MNRLLLLLPMLLVAPVSAQVDPAIHKLCSDVKDYLGCVQANENKKKSIPSSGGTNAKLTLTEFTRIACEETEGGYRQFDEYRINGCKDGIEKN